MDPLTAMAASGLRSRMESLDLLANNLSNTNTAGYKADREFHGVYQAAEAAGGDERMPLIETHWTDHAQGTLAATGNPLDVALSGRGFFAVDGPGGTLYTRNGNFRLSAAGRMVTSDGYAVRAAQGASLTLASGRTVEITPDGTVRQDGQVIGQLEVVDFSGTTGLTKQGNNYFRNTGADKPRPASPETAVEQSRLEVSNVGPAESAVRLVGVMRQFEMLQKAVSVGTEMNRHAIEEVARVGA